MSVSFWERCAELCAHMIWPVSCPVCGTVGSVLCSSCLKSLLKRPQLPRCLRCGKTIPCGVHGSGSLIRAGAVYERDMREVVLMLKYGRYRALGFRLGRGLAEVFPRPDADVLVPVPLHRSSPRRYNQAEAVALGLGEAWNIDVWNAARWRRDAGTQVGMNAAGRISLSHDAFEVDDGIAGLRAGLVDDVCTTGSTLARLDEACRKKGATVIGAFVSAHTLH